MEFNEKKWIYRLEVLDLLKRKTNLFEMFWFKLHYDDLENGAKYKENRVVMFAYS